jgi:hypothetical protein
MNLGRQTRNTLNLTVMAALLLSCLALAEFPELLQLRDDTSNDFALLVSEQEASAGPATAKFVPQPSGVFVQRAKVPPLISLSSVFSSSDFVTHSSVDYLHLLCVHRT